MIYCRRKWQPTPVLLPGKSHGWRSLMGYSPWGRKESDTTERLHFHFLLVQRSCLFSFSLFFLPLFSFLFTLPFPSVHFVCYRFLPFSHYPPSLLPFFFLHPGTHLSRRSTRRASDLIGSHHLLTPSKSLWSRDGRYQTGNFLLWWSLTQTTWTSKGNSGTLQLWKGDMDSMKQ